MVKYINYAVKCKIKLRSKQLRKGPPRILIFSTEIDSNDHDFFFYSAKNYHQRRSSSLM